MVRIKEADEAIARRYQECSPRQFGNMHERMKWLMDKMEQLSDAVPSYADMTERHHTAWLNLQTAIHDLETEVQYHEAKRPPFGRRTVTMG